MTKCQGWINPNDVSFAPIINSLSGYQSPAGSNTLVSINGSHFFSYSTISFGTYTPTVYFINSNILQFYVPSTLGAGTFSVQVTNGSIVSNSVNYTIDNASGYWLYNSNGNISNTNAAGTVISNWMSRGIPVILSDENTFTSSDSAYSIPSNANWIIGPSTTNDCYISLPKDSMYSGREITVKSMGGAIYNNESNIYSLSGGTASNKLVSSKGEWVLIVYDGSTYWYAVQGNTEIQSSVYSVMYTSNQTITMPANCRSIDLVLCGAGGLAGDSSANLYGGSGAGGNIISGHGIPMAGAEVLTLHFTNESTIVYHGQNQILAEALNGKEGLDANGTLSLIEATNNVEGEYDSSMGIFFTAFGSNGATGYTQSPSMIGGFGCPKGSTEWVEGDHGMAQRIPGEKQGKGYCLITYHIGK